MNLKENAMKNAGSYLKNIREEKGYSIQEVSRHTKISPSVLRALEEGRLKDIDPVYLKSFSKMYCRFLGVGWEEFQKEYPLNMAPAVKHASKIVSLAQEKKGESSPGLRSPSFSLNAFILKNKRAVLIVLSVIAGVFFLILSFRGCAWVIRKFPHRQPYFVQKIKKSQIVRPPKQEKVSQAPQARESLTVKSLKPYPEVSQSAPVKAAVIPQEKESKRKDIILTIKAQEDSFLKIKVDGKTVYQGSLRKGKAESWTAKDKIELSVGNAGGIVLEVNGKVFSPLGRRGQAIKNILINSEGLKIL